MKSITKIATVTALALLVFGLTIPVHAAPVATFYLRTDRASYAPGEAGTLFITIRNEGDAAFTIKNMTISFPWTSFINDHWEGNVTISNINTALASGGSAYNIQQAFTIPYDGRARTGSGTVRIGTDIGGGGGSYRTSSFTIVMQSPVYEPISITTSLFPIITVAMLGLVTLLLFMMHQSLRRTGTPVTHRPSHND